MSSTSRYIVYGEIASGGMATVHLGRLHGPNGFSRTVAVKRLHPMLAKDPSFVAMFMDEARIASRIRHPNVVPTLDVVAEGGELLLVMEYIHGESLGSLLRASQALDELPAPSIAANVFAGVLHGLHAAHEATDEMGLRLDIVHRDMSPQNILVGADGVARVLDFGIAKAINRSQNTREGEIRGKLGYMSPEQFDGLATRQSDVYATSVVLWETLTSRRLFAAEDSAGTIGKILSGDVTPPSTLAPGISPALEAVVMQGLARDVRHRFPTAFAMAMALEDAEPVLASRTIGTWVERVARERLATRMAAVNAIESGTPEATAAPTGASSVDLRTITMVIPIGDERPDETPAVAVNAETAARVADTRPAPARPKLARRLVVAAALMAATASGVALVPMVSSSPVVPATATPLPTGSESAPPAPDLPNVATAVDAATIAAEPSAPARGPAGERRPAAQGTRRPAQGSCTPPYREVMVDGHVRRIPKPACL